MDPSAILNFDAPFDVGLFDQVVMSFFTGDNQARQVAQPILVQFREHPQAWTRVDAVLEHSSHSHAKLIALGILESSVRYRWKALPVEQKNGIRNFTLNLIMKLASDPSTLHSEAQIISKLNRVIVEIVKHEWLNWTSFIPDLVHAAKTNESLCANSMLILQILSEEIFDYSSESMTQAKIQELKTNFYSQFRSIFEMCEFVLSASQDPTLLTTTLRTLLRFLVWIPIGFIYETNLIETLAVRFFPTQVFQNDTLRCLSEIGSIKISTEEKAQAYSVKFVQLFHTVIQQVTKLITPETNVAQIYQSGNPGTQTFLRHLTIFITGCLSQHLPILEGGSQEHQAILFQAFFVLLQLSKVDDRVIFKICLEYWSTLVQDLYQTQRSVQGPGGLALGLGQLASRQVSPRLARYQKTMSSLRCVMIEQMSKP
jgi:exportin-1